MPIRNSTAVWRDSLRDGEGRLSLGSGAWEGQYTYRSRFREGEPKQSNPEELVAAGHAGCFSMALANNLEDESHSPEEIRTTADCHLEMDDTAGPTITRLELTTEVVMEGIDPDRFQQIAEESKSNCPVSRALAGVDIELDATLVD